MNAEIVIVGREILTGHTRDTNSGYLAAQISRLGGRVQQIVVVDDDVGQIREAVGASLARRVTLLVTSGGLGPTFDDLTLKAVALSLDRPLILHREARRWIASRYDDLHRLGSVDSPHLTPEREKMAYLPEGAEPLPNRVGTAPAVWLRAGDSCLTCLPGVPAELTDTFETEVEPRIRPLFRDAAYGEQMWETNYNDESLLTRVLDQVRPLHPGVHFKSKATGFGAQVRLQVCLGAWGHSEGDVGKKLEQALRDLRQALGETE